MLPSDTIVLLLVDQFEELFRYTDVREATLHDALERAERRDEAVAFVQLLLEAARVKAIPFRIVLTMRADFTGDCGRYLGLAEAVSAAQFLLPRLSREQLEKVVTGPVASAGGTIDHALVQRLLNDAGTDLDQLPILQHALMRTWDQAIRRSGVTPPALELSDYVQIGGIDHALSQHADAAYAALVKEDPALEPVIEAVFKALTDVDRKGRAVRCPRRLDRLRTIVVDPQEEFAAANKRLRIVLESFRAHEMNFLMPPPEVVLDDRTVIDISHEALISHWQRLAGTVGSRGWVKEEARDGERYRALLELMPGPLTGRQVIRWNRWWRERHRTPGWAERYGGRFDEVSRMIRASRMRARLALSGAIALVIFGLAFVQETWMYFREMTAREAAEANVAKLKQANQLLEVSLKSLSPSQPTSEPSSQSPPIIGSSDSNVTVTVGSLANDVSQNTAKLTALLQTMLLNDRQQQDALKRQQEEDALKIAQKYKESVLASQPGDNAKIAAVKAAAQKAISEGQLGKAGELLADVEKSQTAALEHLALNAAQTAAQGGDVALTRLRYLDAAKRFAEAAAKVPAGHDDERWKYLNKEADALYRQGHEFGDNEAARSAIERYRHLAELRPRNTFPLDWAKTQNNLGNALRVLGERESGTARLEEAVAAFREALQEDTRARAPLEWAATQNNLGNALRVLGERESGTARLEEAVAAFREALQENTRARAPLEWAATQNNLGNALRVLGERESGTARLEEAVAGFREALQERTRARVPLDWANTQANLGAALAALGQRESGSVQLDEAVTDYRAALTVLTRERVPLDWARTQSRLGTALVALGQREILELHELVEAIAAYRQALELFRAAGVSYYADLTQADEAAAEKVLAARRR